MSLFKTLLGVAAASFIPGLGGLLPGSGMGKFFGSTAGKLAMGAIGGKILGNSGGGDTGDLEARMAKFNSGGPSREGALKNLFASRYGSKDGSDSVFDSAEARDAYDAVQRKELDVINPLFSSAANGGIMSFQRGGLIEGPGTVTSDDIDGTVRQDGVPVQDIAVSNGEVIMSGRDLAALDPEGDMDRAGMRLGGAANGSRGAEAARMFSEVQNIKGA